MTLSSFYHVAVYLFLYLFIYKFKRKFPTSQFSNEANKAQARKTEKTQTEVPGRREPKSESQKKIVTLFADYWISSLMVSVNPNPAQGFHFFDPMNMGLPGVNSLPPPTAVPPTTATTSSTSASVDIGLYADEYNKKIRKPYTITKSRESWSEQEHDKFLEALQL